MPTGGGSCSASRPIYVRGRSLWNCNLSKFAFPATRTHCSALRWLAAAHHSCVAGLASFGIWHLAGAQREGQPVCAASQQRHDLRRHVHHASRHHPAPPDLAVEAAPAPVPPATEIIERLEDETQDICVGAERDGDSLREPLLGDVPMTSPRHPSSLGL